MTDKNILSTKNTLLEEWSLKGSSTLSSGLSLTSSLLSGHTSKGSGFASSSQGTAGGHLSLSTNLRNPLLGGSHLQCSSGLTLSADTTLSLSPLKLSITPSHINAESGLGSGLTSFKPYSSPRVETSLTKLSLSQDDRQTARSVDNKTVSRASKKSPRKRHTDATLKTVKKSKVQSSSDGITSEVIKSYTVNPPEYAFKYEKESEFMDVDLSEFTLPKLPESFGKTIDVIGFKQGLLNCIGGSLLMQPKFTRKDDVMRDAIIAHASNLLLFDPEFILKAALYARKELNIRTTSNFLLAFAANEDFCRVFLKKYFCACIALPTDWIEVAIIFQTLEGSDLKFGALPAALRKAMISKFPEFDKYQLAKYNKGKSSKKKIKEKKVEVKRRHCSESDTSDEENENERTDESMQDSGVEKETAETYYEEEDRSKDFYRQKFTIKQLIRKLHIKEPVEHVMCLIGKKYPMTPEEFYKSRLPGVWEQERAGKRMKLPVPETWETQVSLKGNKAKTWEDLIDHKKLPFMAMLRNLRNMIKAGISPKHHNNVLWRLTDQKSVVNSKQFPFRFFSAYEVLDQLQKDYDTYQEKIILDAEQAALGLPSGENRWGENKFGRRDPAISKAIKNSMKKSADSIFPWWILKKMKKAAKDKCTTVNEVLYDKNLIERYRKAVDTAVKIATVHNVQPIKGRTLLLCETSFSLNKPCSSARGLGIACAVNDIVVLMGLMCKYSCEDCEMIVFNEDGYTTVSLDNDTILGNMKRILKCRNLTNWSSKDVGFPYSQMFEKLTDRIQVDSLLIFGDNFLPNNSRGAVVKKWLESYRHLVNPNLLFVSVNFTGTKGAATGIDDCGNDIYISGYSDSILRFIAERGNVGQVNHVDKIDIAFQLQPVAGVSKPHPDMSLAPESLLQPAVPTPSWRTVRVFISSTFKDMHAERDILTRFVFPELRALGRKHFINIYETDLRWGLTEEDTKDNRTVEVCLKEVSRCQLFVGILGERYGWIPDATQIPDTEEYDWVRHYTPSASVTELEMHLGALSDAQKTKDTAFFYIRDNSFETDIPKVFTSDFTSESEMHRTKINTLKQKIRGSGLEVYDGYPCHWGGCVDGKPMVAGLEEFGRRVLNTLANAINKLYPEKHEILSEDNHIDQLQWAFIENISCDFIGRKRLVDEVTSKIKSTKSGIIGLVGKPGSGKTSLMASVINQKLADTGRCGIFMNIAGAAPGTNSLSATVRRLSQKINFCFGLGHILPEDFKNLTVKLNDLLDEAGSMGSSKVLVFLDGIDQMDSVNEPFSLEWIPKPVPDNVVFVITANEGEKTHASLKRLTAIQISVGALDMWDKADIVRQTLAKHRKSLEETGFGNQMKLLMLKKDAQNPLYLKLACEELRVFGVFEKISDKLKTLPHTTAQMLQEILNRLEEDHGTDIVPVAICLLACARNGLYPEELYELINWHRQLGEDKFEPRDICNLDLKTDIPLLKFHFLARSIMCFLNPSSTWTSLLSIANKEICTAVRLRYLKGTDSSLEIRLHTLLAGFFMKQANGSCNWESQNTKAFSELPYHLACSGHFHELEGVLCNHYFIQRKCSLGLAATLIDDFTPKAHTVKKAHQKELALFTSLPRVQQFKSFISRNAEIFAIYPSLELQQAINEPSSSIPYQEAVNIKQARGIVSPYIEWSNKPETESQCYMKLSNFKMPLTCVAISPDSTKFAAGSEDLLVRLFDMETGKELCFFRGHSDQITDVCFVGNNMLCSASADTTLSIWDVENKHRIHTLKNHGRRVNSCAANRKGDMIASGGWDCCVYVWNPTSGEKTCEFHTSSPVNCVDFHPTDELVVVGTWDSLIRIYNYFTKTRVAILRGHRTSVRDISYSFDGWHLASASIDGDIKIWEAKTGAQVGNIRGHSGPINKLTFSPGGRELITASDDHQIKVWSAQLGIPLRRIHTDNFGAATSVALDPDGSTVAVGYHSGQVVTYDVNTGVKIAKVTVSYKPVQVLTFSQLHVQRYMPCNLYAGCDDGSVKILDSNHGTVICSLLGHTKPVLCVASAYECVATGGEDGICCLYENELELRSSKINKPNVILKGHRAAVTACSFNADTTMLATASRDASIRIYTLSNVFKWANLEPTEILHACHADWINACVWSNTGDFLVTGSNDFNLKVWNTKNYTEKATLTGHSSAVNTVAYKYGCIVSGSSDGDLKVWSHKGPLITTLSGHKLRVNACDIHVKCITKDNVKEREPENTNWADITEMEVDGNTNKPPAAHPRDVNVQDVTVASAGDDGDVWLWKPLKAQTLSCLADHSDRVLSVAADKHNHIISCSLDCTLRLWQPKLKDEINQARHEAPVTFISMSTNGLRAISGSQDGVIKIWVLEGDSQLRLKHSFQAHDKSVNCGCFEGEIIDQFVTGGDDCFINLWEISYRKDGFLVKKRDSFTTDTPVFGLARHIIPGIFHYVTWSGKIAGAKLMTKQIVHFDTTIMGKSPSDIRGALKCVETNELLIGTTSNSVLIVKLGHCVPSSSVVAEQIFIEQDQGDKYNKKPEDTKTSDNWVNCFAKSEEVLFAGDSRGQIFVQSSNLKKTMKIHKLAITALEMVDNVIFTGSADSTIKVWNFKVSDTIHLSQVGQFFSPSPVTSLVVPSNVRCADDISFLAGDQLGNILHLRWHR